jgi:preprotein translocase subunit SecE
MVIGGLIAGATVVRYYVKPDIRAWADEVAEELSKVKWPNRKEVGNHTVVVIAATFVLMIYLTLLDRFWGFVTNLIYASGA